MRGTIKNNRRGDCCVNSAARIRISRTGRLLCGYMSQIERNNQHHADLLGVTRTTVRLWIERWKMASGILEKAATDEDEKALSVAICRALADVPRPGRPAEFTPELICQIVALGCEKPEDLGRPISHWTQRELNDEVMKRNLVDQISPRSVGRFLKRCRP
jgi:putative transposase